MRKPMSRRRLNTPRTWGRWVCLVAMGLVHGGSPRGFGGCGGLRFRGLASCELVDADPAHSRGFGGGNTGVAVFEDETLGGRYAEEFRRF